MSIRRSMNGFNGIIALLGVLLIILGILFSIWKSVTKPTVATIVLQEQKMSSEEQGIYTTHVSYPQIVSPTDDTQRMVNSLLLSQVKQLSGDFTKSAKEQAVSLVASESSLLITYQPFSVNGNIMSVQFLVATYLRGSAHPFVDNSVFNYSFIKHTEVTLDTLFNRKSGYVSFLETLVKKDLAKQDKAMDSDYGSFLPSHMTKDNFQKFVLTKDAIIFLFDPGTAGPDVVGTRKVSVAYALLSNYFNNE